MITILIVLIIIILIINNKETFCQINKLDDVPIKSPYINNPQYNTDINLKINQYKNELKNYFESIKNKC